MVVYLVLLVCFKRSILLYYASLPTNESSEKELLAQHPIQSLTFNVGTDLRYQLTGDISVYRAKSKRSTPRKISPITSTTDGLPLQILLYFIYVIPLLYVLSKWCCS